MYVSTSSSTSVAVTGSAHVRAGLGVLCDGALRRWPPENAGGSFTDVTVTLTVACPEVRLPSETV